MAAWDGVSIGALLLMGAFGMPKGVAAHGRPWTPMALKAAYLMAFRHKKRRPWTSLFDHLVGRGNLKWMPKFLKTMKIRQLNYSCGIPFGIPDH